MNSIRQEKHFIQIYLRLEMVCSSAFSSSFIHRWGRIELAGHGRPATAWSLTPVSFAMIFFTRDSQNLPWQCLREQIVQPHQCSPYHHSSNSTPFFRMPELLRLRPWDKSIGWNARERRARSNRPVQFMKLYAKRDGECGCC